MKILLLSVNRTEKIAEPLQNVGADLTVITSKYSSRTKRYLHILYQLFVSLICHEHDACIVNGTRLIGILGMVFSILSRTCLVVRLGGDIWKTHAQKRQQARHKGDYATVLRYYIVQATDAAVIGSADGIIVVSEDLKSAALSHTKFSESHIQVVPQHVNVNQFNSIDSSEPSNNSETLLTVTNLNYAGKSDGVIEIIQAIQPLLQEKDNLEYVIAGGGQYEDRVREYISSNLGDDIRYRVKLLGYVENIRELYLSADIFLYASYNDSFPNVVLEAGAAGLPRVLAGDSCLKEQVRIGETGFYIDPFNHRAFRTKVNEMIINDQRAEYIGRKARESVLADHPPKIIGGQLVMALSKICIE